MEPLYRAVVAHGRAVHWYDDGAVPDTLDGRFDMIAAVLSFALVRLEQLDRRQESVWLTELFIDDMEAQIREMGIGDVVVGKHVGRMVSALGGRLCTYREALLREGDLKAALARNLYRGEPVEDKALDHVASRLREFAAGLAVMTADDIIKGQLPR